MKRCSTCGEMRSLDEFYRNASAPDGRRGDCKRCYSAKHKRRKSGWAREHYDPTIARRRNRAYRDEHRDELAKYDKQRAQTPERKILQRRVHRNWYERNRQRKLTQNRARSGRKAYDDAGSWYAQILRRDPCSYCGEPAGEADHIEPWSRVQDGSPGNLTAACLSCNRSKATKPLLSFLREKAVA